MLAVYFLRHRVCTFCTQYKYNMHNTKVFSHRSLISVPQVYKIIKVASHAAKNIFKRMLCSKELTQFKCGAVI